MDQQDCDEPLSSGLLLHAGAIADATVVAMLAGPVDPPEQVAAWCDAGRVYTLRKVADPGPPVAVALVLEAPFAWVAELRSLVVAAEQRRLGLARRVLLGIADDLRGRGLRLVVTSVPSVRDGWLVPLRQAGFEPASATRGIGESNREIRAGDAFWLTLAL